MSRPREEPRIYKHETLLHELNNMMMRIKIHLGENEEALGKSATRLKLKYPVPTSQELNGLHQRINEILKKDYTMRKY